MRNLLLLLGITLFTLTACTKPCDDEGGVPDHDHYSSVGFKLNEIINVSSGTFSKDPQATGEGIYKAVIGVRLFNDSGFREEQISVEGTAQEVEEQINGFIIEDVQYDVYNVLISITETIPTGEFSTLRVVSKTESIVVNGSDNNIDMTLAPNSGFIKVNYPTDGYEITATILSEVHSALNIDLESGTGAYVNPGTHSVNISVNRDGVFVTGINQDVKVDAGKYVVINVEFDQGSATVSATVVDDWSAQ